MRGPVLRNEVATHPWQRTLYNQKGEGQAGLCATLRCDSSLGCLIFLAYESGDAFALDMDDKYACPLSLDGEKQRFPLFDSGTKWAFRWPLKYSVARGRILFHNIDGEDSSGLPWMNAGAIEREVTRYNRRAGTNYHL
jgi:hypothetical protein